MVNRWELVRAVCEAGRDADDRVAVLPMATPADAPSTPPVATATGAAAPAPQDRLPLVQRASMQTWCRDAEPGREGEIVYEYLRYDAGMRAEAVEEPWKAETGWEALPEAARAAWLPPEAEPKGLVVYRFLEGPGTLDAEAGRIFYAWLARLAWRSSLAEGAEAVAPRPAAPANGADAARTPVKTDMMFKYPAPAAAPAPASATTTTTPGHAPAPSTDANANVNANANANADADRGGGFRSGGT